MADKIESYPNFLFNACSKYISIASGVIIAMQWLSGTFNLLLVGASDLRNQALILLFISFIVFQKL